MVFEFPQLQIVCNSVLDLFVTILSVMGFKKLEYIPGWKIKCFSDIQTSSTTTTSIKKTDFFWKQSEYFGI